MAKLEYLDILSRMSDEDLEDEYGWHQMRGKLHRRNGRYGLYWWHLQHAHLICEEIGRREQVATEEFQPEQLSLTSPAELQWRKPPPIGS